MGWVAAFAAWRLGWAHPHGKPPSPPGTSHAIVHRVHRAHFAPKGGSTETGLAVPTPVPLLLSGADAHIRERPAPSRPKPAFG